MKFYAPPGHTVRINTPFYQRLLKRKYILFNENGEYETDIPILVKALTALSSQNDSPINIENNADTGEPIKLKHCKKCDFTCTNQGDLLAHYRKEHKGGKLNASTD